MEVTIFTKMHGKKFEKIHVDNNVINFYIDCNQKYPSFTLLHVQSCCEDVYIESIVGDIQDLMNTPILMAEKVTDYSSACEQWTFIKFATIKGYVDIRFNGESNGYYSMDVDLIEYDKFGNKLVEY